mmetsp:Transcript_127948/g.292309  ORF Transcript_127948/g.292309 Transcript_127948/m.292309 type:complete len:221 (-) Transcript_127948:339-1001(-)
MSGRSRSPHGRSVQSARSTSLDMAALVRGAVARSEADRSSVAPSLRGSVDLRATPLAVGRARGARPGPTPAASTASRVPRSGPAPRYPGRGDDDFSPPPSPVPSRAVGTTQRAPQSRVMADIRALRSSTALVIPRAPFRRLVRELTQERVGDDEEDYRWTSTGLNALQTAVEDYLVGIFEDSTVASLHARRVTCMLQDIRLVRRLRLHNEVQGENPRHGW